MDEVLGIASMEIGKPMEPDEQVEVLYFFQIEVRFDNPEEEDGPFYIPDATWRGLAKDEATAESLAYDICWDSRLNTTGCYPVYETERIPRYCSRSGWGHIFVGTREETTRWIYDRGARSLVAAQVLNGCSWVKLEAAPMAHLLESIQAIDPSAGAEPIKLDEWDSVPTWEDVATLEVTKEHSG